MKYLLLTFSFLLFSACGIQPITKVGDCWYTERWEKGFKVLKVVEFGVFGTVITRQDTIRMRTGISKEVNMYITYRNFKNLYFEKIDCEAFDIEERSVK